MASIRVDGTLMFELQKKSIQMNLKYVVTNIQPVDKIYHRPVIVEHHIVQIRFTEPIPSMWIQLELI